MEMLHYKLPMTDRAMALRLQMRLNYLGHTALVSRDNTLYIEAHKEIRGNGLIQLSKETFEAELWDNFELEVGQEEA